jgi:hypothetical protein
MTLSAASGVLLIMRQVVRDIAASSTRWKMTLVLMVGNEKRKPDELIHPAFE